MENIKDNQLIPPQPSLIENEKRVYAQYTCANCGVNSPECGFYKNPKLIRGHIPWCVSCHLKRTVGRRKAKREGIGKPDGRKCRPRMSEEDKAKSGRERSKKHYYKNLEKSREYSRDYARKNTDPEKKRRSMLKAKYGMTPEGWQAMFEAQGCKCAICESKDAGAKAGWNTDHCHKSGRVRFILCAHCNRGLGSFKDNPDVMRKAAKMIEELSDQPAGAGIAQVIFHQTSVNAYYDGKYQNQPDKPVEAING